VLQILYKSLYKYLIILVYYVKVFVYRISIYIKDLRLEVTLSKCDLLCIVLMFSVCLRILMHWQLIEV
jgi:hypothetical protein